MSKAKSLSEVITGMIEELDLVSVVRCKDCKHSRFFDPCFYCYEFGEEIIVPENGFCFMAERRVGEADDE